MKHQFPMNTLFKDSAPCSWTVNLGFSSSLGRLYLVFFWSPHTSCIIRAKFEEPNGTIFLVVMSSGWKKLWNYFILHEKIKNVIYSIWVSCSTKIFIIILWLEHYLRMNSLLTSLLLAPIIIYKQFLLVVMLTSWNLEDTWISLVVKKKKKCLFFCQWEGDGSLIAIFKKKNYFYMQIPLFQVHVKKSRVWKVMYL